MTENCEVNTLHSFCVTDILQGMREQLVVLMPRYSLSRGPRIARAHLQLSSRVTIPSPPWSHTRRPLVSLREECVCVRRHGQRSQSVQLAAGNPTWCQARRVPVEGFCNGYILRAVHIARLFLASACPKPLKSELC